MKSLAFVCFDISDGNLRVSVIDRILCACESIRQGIHRLISKQYSSELPSNDMQCKLIIVHLVINFFVKENDVNGHFNVI